MRLKCTQAIDASLSIQKDFKSEKRDFILNPLSDREPVGYLEDWNDVHDTLKFVWWPKQDNVEHAGDF